MQKETITAGILVILSTIVSGSLQMLLSKDKPSVRVLVWSEASAPKNVYPNDINAAIAEHLSKQKNLIVKTASLNDPEQGLSQEALDNTDVLFWWGHKYHNKVEGAAVDRIIKRVKEGGMGFVAIHSAHYSKPFKALLNAPADLGGWREDGSPEHVHVVTPSHPIAKGIKDFTIPHTEMYNEPFKVPEPEVVVFHSKWDKGEEFRSGCIWTIGKGKVFYFRPGHETYPIMHDPNVVKILTNAAFWAAAKDNKEKQPEMTR